MKINGDIMNVTTLTKWQGRVTIVMLVFAVMTVASKVDCNSRCSCSDLAVLCHGCPNAFPPDAVTERTEHVLVDECRKPFGNFSGDLSTPKSMLKLTIINSELTDVASIERFMTSVESLILQNNSIETVAFRQTLPNITFLDLSFNRLSTLVNNSFLNLPNIKYLDLSQNTITKMTSNCFVGLIKLQHLDLSLNNMTYLSKVFSPLVSLQHLNLSWNHIELLPEGCFSSLFMLQHLDISYNRLTSVAPGALQFLPNLARLLLADNPKLGINQLDGQLLVGTGRRLQQVDASRTGLIQVPETLTHSVRFLNLAGNKIATINCGDLDSYPLLQTLDFTDNVINVIEDDALGRLELLSKLHLNNNNLRAVPKMLPSELTELSLNHNLISNLTITDFINMPNLKVLLLAKNDIYYIEENVFIQLFSLQVLDLSNNPIKIMTPSTLNGPSALKELNLSYLDIAIPATDIFFPVPTPEGLERLNLRNSPGLTYQLLADTAILAALTRLQYLDISYTHLTSLRSDLIYYLSQLRTLKFEGNEIPCTELNWLVNWFRDNPNNDSLMKCFYSNMYQHDMYNKTKTVHSTSTTISTVQDITRAKELTIKIINITDEHVDMKNEKYENKNYDTSNIMRDISERRDPKNNKPVKTLKLKYQRPTMRAKKNDTEPGKKSAARIILQKSNIRRLVDFFRASNKTRDSVVDASADGNNTITSKDTERGESTIEGETPADAAQGEITSEGSANGVAAASREPQPVASRVLSSASEMNKTASRQQTPAFAFAKVSGNLCGAQENNNNTVYKTKCSKLSQEPSATRKMTTKDIKMAVKEERKSLNGSLSIKQIENDTASSRLAKLPNLKAEYKPNTKKITVNNEKKEASVTTHIISELSKESHVRVSEVISNMSANINLNKSIGEEIANESLNKSRFVGKSSNESKSEWSPYSDERLSRNHSGTIVALGAVCLCIGMWAAIYLWSRRRTGRNRCRPHLEVESIEVPSVTAPGGLW